MAVTKIIPIRTTIQNSVDYICNPAKTDDRLLVHSENCFPRTAGLEFQHYLQQVRAGGNTIGRHLIQSFAPGEVSPEAAHEIGKKLAAEILKGEYGFVMATHVDRGHVHNHFVWCAANIVTHTKYRSNINTYHEIRNISDKLCKEYELSVIEPQATKTYGKSYDSYRPDQTSGSWRQKLQATIDSLIPQANDFEDLLKLMEAQGYKIKRGKHISFCAPEQERFTRMKSIGEGYTEEEIRKRILEKPEHKTTEPPRRRSNESLPPAQAEKPETIKPLIDIAGNRKFAESKGLTHWAKLQNLKNSAAAFSMMMSYGGMEAFMKLYTDCKNDVATIENGIAANNEQIKAIGYWRKDIITYNRTKPIYKEYEETKFFKERFLKKHESDITAHELAEAELRNYPRPLPKVKELDARIKRLKAANVNNHNALTPKKAELKQLSNIHGYLYHLNLTHQPPPPPREQEQTRTRKRSNDFDR
jgi:hypothetical protein